MQRTLNMTEDDIMTNLRDRWQKLGSGPQTEAGMSRAVDNAVRHRAGTLTRKVRKTYSMYVALGVAMALCGPLLLLIGFSALTAILYLVFGIIYTAFVIIQRRRLAVLDEVDIPCLECARRTLRLRKTFDRFFIVSPLLALPVLYSFFADILAMSAYDPARQHGLYAAIVGGIIGGIIGLIFDLRTRRRLTRIYRTFISEGEDGE